MKPTADGSEICNFLLSLDIYCHGRKDGECHGTAIQEATLHSLPVVSHKALMNGHIEIIGNCGRVCDGEDDYENYLTQLILDTELRTRLGNCARKLAVKEYLVDNIKDKIESIYLELFNSKQVLKQYSRTVPRGGYRGTSLLKLFFYRVKYGIFHPAKIPFIIRRTLTAVYVKIKNFLKYSLKM